MVVLSENCGFPEQECRGGPWRSVRIWLANGKGTGKIQAVFSHIVIFWTDPGIPGAAEDLIAGAEKYLKPIPGVSHFHVGRMVTSHRPVVDQSYQVALNVVFPDKAAQDAYQVHPLHLEFVDKVFKRVCKKVVVYDFE
jgi:hypothetical protein